MKYISAKEFLNQSKQVQDTILDWWQPSIGDIYCNRYGMPLGDILVINNGNFNWKSFKDDVKQYGIPLLTEGQLKDLVREVGNMEFNIQYGGMEEVWKLALSIIKGEEIK